jgi:hypothetical protein
MIIIIYVNPRLIKLIIQLSCSHLNKQNLCLTQYFLNTNNRVIQIKKFTEINDLRQN